MKEIFETIFLLAFIQGVLLSLILFFRKENHSANIFLSIGIFALSFELFASVYYSKGWYYDFPWFMGITYPIAYLYGPVFYIYTKLLTKKIEKVHPVNLLHLIPYLTGYIITIPIFILPTAEKIAVVEKMFINQQPLIYSIYERLISVQGIIYTVLTVLLVIDYNKKIKERFSNIDKINLNWLKYFTIGMIVCWSLASASEVVDVFVNNDLNMQIALHVAISILIYSIGYMGLKQPEIFMKPVDIQTPEKQTQKYKKSGLDDAMAEEIKTKLIALIENEKPYCDSDLTLNKLAEMLDTSSHNLSEVINTYLGKSYYDFINEYRVEEFKNKLKDPSTRNYNLLSIAFESGFKSKTSFNTIFKKHTNQTPSEYKATLNQ